MDAFEIEQVAAERRALDTRYLEFLRHPSMRLGLYVLGAGQDDPQQPHAEDEAYYVIRGRATIRVADEDRPVQPGSVIYVAAGVPHTFHTIEEELELLVFFAPAEGAGQPAA